MPIVIIELVRSTDYLRIAALDRLAWPIVPDVFIPDGEHLWGIRSDTATLLVARVADAASPLLRDSLDIAGALVKFATSQGELLLHKIMVHPDCRGIGRKLMKAALAQADAPVLLTVDPNNKPAVRLYEQLGFTVRKHIRGFYRPHPDRYLMAHSKPEAD